MSQPRTAQALTWRSSLSQGVWSWWSIAVFAIVISVTLTAVAQRSQPARIDGTVTGESRVPLRGARITLRPANATPVLMATTDAAGAFTFRAVPPGRYRVDVTYKMLHAASNEPLLFESGETYTLDLPMSPGDPEWAALLTDAFAHGDRM